MAGRPSKSAGLWKKRFVLYGAAILLGPWLLLALVRLGLIASSDRKPKPGPVAKAQATAIPTRTVARLEPTARPAAISPTRTRPSPRPSATPPPPPTKTPLPSPTPVPPKMLTGDFIYSNIPRPKPSDLISTSIENLRSENLEPLPSGAMIAFRFLFDKQVYLYIYNVQVETLDISSLFPVTGLTPQNPLPGSKEFRTPERLGWPLGTLESGIKSLNEQVFIVHSSEPRKELVQLHQNFEDYVGEDNGHRKRLLRTFLSELRRPRPGSKVETFIILHIP